MMAIFTASVLAALLASVVLRIRNRWYRTIEQSEGIGTNHGDSPTAKVLGVNRWR